MTQSELVTPFMSFMGLESAEEAGLLCESILFAGERFGLPPHHPFLLVAHRHKQIQMS